MGVAALGTTVAANLANAVVSGSVADLVGQTFELSFGWRCQYDPWQTASAGVFSGVFAGGAMGFQRALATACFPEETRIDTDRGEKTIREIHAGDLVRSADPVTGKQSYQRVTRTFVRQADALLKIETEDGRSVEATREHPFFVEGKGFIAAKRLARSDLLVDDHGRAHAVLSVTERRGKFTVYNFEVEGTHTYYASGFWVHNDCSAIAFRRLLRMDEGWVYRLEPADPTVRNSYRGNLGGPDVWRFHDVYMDNNGIVYDPMQGYRRGIPLEQWLSTPHPNTPFPEAYQFRPLELHEINSLKLR